MIKCDSCGCSGVCVDEDIDADVSIDVGKGNGLIQIYFDNVENYAYPGERVYLCEPCHADLSSPDLTKWWLLK